MVHRPTQISAPGEFACDNVANNLRELIGMDAGQIVGG